MDIIHFKDKVDKETASQLQTTFAGVNVLGLPTTGKKPVPSLAGQTVTFTIGDASFQGTADSKGKVATPFNAMLKGTTFSLKYKGLPLISLLPLAAPDGKGKSVAVHFKVTATVPGQTAVVLVDKTVGLIYSATKGNFSGKGPAPKSDTTVPTIASTYPLDAATGVLINQQVTATFSEEMDSSTITSFTMSLQQGTTPVTGTVSYAAGIATFTLSSDLAPDTVYTATVSTGAKDLAGNALASNFVWTFTTGATADSTPPTVTSTNPTSNASGVAINTAIAATFSEAMSPSSLTAATFTLQQGTTAVQGSVSYSGTTATFAPAANLTASTVYTASISTGATDLAGNPLAANVVWTFTTGAAADSTPPTVTSTNPANNASGVAINAGIAGTFSEAMSPSSLTTTTFTLQQGTTAVQGSVSYNGTTATFAPTGNLTASTIYTATISTGAKDLAGNPLAANFIWSFTTGATAAKGPAPVSLGMAGNFAILAKSGIDTVPTSAVTGDIGVSPAAATFITGFGLTADSSNVFATSPQVTGKVYAANYAVPTPSNLTTAVSDMETAFTDAAGRPTPDFTDLGAGDISGLTLVPGLYKWGTGLSINTDITLAGGPNDVWIFQVSKDITQANGVKIILTGGALPKNIFWQSAGVVSLGTTAHFEGVILSQTAITLDTGASINGRLLSQTAVTLKSSTVTQPAP
jgi:methionine-rich copper-binding protein CopC